jgi:hypothetical protein
VPPAAAIELNFIVIAHANQIASASSSSSTTIRTRSGYVDRTKRRKGGGGGGKEIMAKEGWKMVGEKGNQMTALMAPGGSWARESKMPSKISRRMGWVLGPAREGVTRSRSV